MDELIPRRGDIYFADLGYGIGSEQSGNRPVVVIQNDAGNKYGPTVIVAPVTSKTKEFITHVQIDEGGLRTLSSVELEQIRVVDKSRLGNFSGHLSTASMAEIDEKIKISLALNGKGEEQKMNDLMVSTKMTSMQIAEVTGKRHADVIRDIRDEIERLESGGIGSQRKFAFSERSDPTGRKIPYYELTKEGILQLAARYDAVIRARLIEMALKQDRQLPSNYKEALLALAAAEEEREHLQLESSIKDQVIKELKPRADYTDHILKNKGLVTITQISKDYGMSGKEMNKTLHKFGVQYKQSEQWLLYEKYQNKGYTQSETIAIIRSDGRADIKMNTKWTQKGRLFIYGTLKKNGILPVIERQQEVPNERFKARNHV
jgi:mRNA-degrading endonuclease toxin of MazEF toxin-antitoxin module/phage antirepressor YoqD-like protein